MARIANSYRLYNFQIPDIIKQDAELSQNSEDGIHTHSQESKESIRSRSVAAKQEVVQKARKFLKRLTPEEKEMGSDEPTKTFSPKGPGSKGMSTNITSPLEVKSLVIISRETRLECLFNKFIWISAYKTCKKKVKFLHSKAQTF